MAGQPSPSTNPFFAMQQQYATMLPTPAPSPYNPFLQQAAPMPQFQYAAPQQPYAPQYAQPYGQPTYQWGPG